MRWKKHILIAAAGLILGLPLCGLAELAWEKGIREAFRGLFGSERRPVTLDEKGIPFTDYEEAEGREIGRQRNPLQVADTARTHYEESPDREHPSKQKFLNCVEWLIADAADRGSFATVEYRFDWPIYGMTDPWRSALAQARTLRALTLAHEFTKQDRYLEVSKKFLRAFFVETKNGGLTLKSDDEGWWYEEAADDGAPESRIWNGMATAVIELHAYHGYTKDPDAKLLVDRGVVDLKRTLHRYDHPEGGSRYHIGSNKVRQDYLKVHLECLKKLHAITGEGIFAEYHDKWSRYLRPPLVVRLLRGPSGKDFRTYLITAALAVLLIEAIAAYAARRRARKGAARDVRA
ncbi:MAG: D-glucuronyl C5-epimerase family protein [Planctomycetota bacterium]|jgi:hypothetical protein